MLRLTHAGVFVASAALGLSLLMLVAGLAMSARPELFSDLGLGSAAKAGLAVALVGGIGAVGSAVLVRVLDLLSASLGDEDSTVVF